MIYRLQSVTLEGSLFVRNLEKILETNSFRLTSVKFVIDGALKAIEGDTC